MLSKARLQHIAEMEEILNQSETFLAEAEQFLQKWLDF